jgi:glycogen debranching enzyme
LSEDQGWQGLYEHDIRLLARYRLLVNGRVPRLAALSAVDAYSTLGYYVSHPSLEAAPQRTARGDRQVVIRVARFVGQGMHEDVEITNHGLSAADLELAWELDTDFADLLEARAGARQQAAPRTVTWQAGRGPARNCASITSIRG